MGKKDNGLSDAAKRNLEKVAFQRICSMVRPLRSAGWAGVTSVTMVVIISVGGLWDERADRVP